MESLVFIAGQYSWIVNLIQIHDNIVWWINLKCMTNGLLPCFILHQGYNLWLRDTHKIHKEIYHHKFYLIYIGKSRTWQVVPEPSVICLDWFPHFLSLFSHCISPPHQRHAEKTSVQYTPIPLQCIYIKGLKIVGL